MDYKAARKLSKRAIATHKTETMLTVAARRAAPRVAGGTPVDKGNTQRSTRVVRGFKSASGDRPAVRIVQEGRGTRQDPGAPVPANFRQHRDYMLRGLAGGV